MGAGEPTYPYTSRVIPRKLGTRGLASGGVASMWAACRGVRRDFIPGVNLEQHSSASAARLPREAPVGHRRPTARSVPQDQNLTPAEKKQRQLDEALDKN